MVEALACRHRKRQLLPHQPSLRPKKTSTISISSASPPPPPLPAPTPATTTIILYWTLIFLLKLGTCGARIAFATGQLATSVTLLISLIRTKNLQLSHLQASMLARPQFSLFFPCCATAPSSRSAPLPSTGPSRTRRRRRRAWPRRKWRRFKSGGRFSPCLHACSTRFPSRYRRWSRSCSARTTTRWCDGRAI